MLQNCSNRNLETGSVQGGSKKHTSMVHVQRIAGEVRWPCHVSLLFQEQRQRSKRVHWPKEYWTGLEETPQASTNINKHRSAGQSLERKKTLFAMRLCTVRNCLCPSLSPSTDVKLQCLHHVSVGGPKSAREDQCKGRSWLNSRGSRIWQTWGPLTPRSPPKLNL